jgi:hypothetical protein
VRLSDPLGVTLGTLGIIVANMMLIAVREFASHTGLRVRWWSRSYASERQHLRTLVLSNDVILARKARRYLRLEIVAWTAFVISGGVFVWGLRNR